MLGRLVNKRIIPYWLYICLGYIPQLICIYFGLQYLDSYKWYYLFAIPVYIYLQRSTTRLSIHEFDIDAEYEKIQQKKANPVTEIPRYPMWEAFLNLSAPFIEEGTWNLFLWGVLEDQWGSLVTLPICIIVAWGSHYLFLSQTRETLIGFLVDLSIFGIIRLVFGSAWASLTAHLFSNGIKTIFLILDYYHYRKEFRKKALAES